MAHWTHNESPVIPSSCGRCRQHRVTEVGIHIRAAFSPQLARTTPSKIVQVVMTDLLPMYAVILGSHHVTKALRPPRCTDRQARLVASSYREGPNTVFDNDVRKSRTSIL
jgi:hypothetical protein